MAVKLRKSTKYEGEIRGYGIVEGRGVAYLGNTALYCLGINRNAGPEADNVWVWEGVVRRHAGEKVARKQGGEDVG